MNAIVRNTVAIALIAVATAAAYAQTSIQVAPAETSAGADLPKSLKGKWYGWSMGSRITRDIEIVLADASDPNNIKGTLSFEDRDCPAYSQHHPIDKLRLAGDTLYVDTPHPAECVRINPGEFWPDSRLVFSLRISKSGNEWKAKGNGGWKAPSRSGATLDFSLTSP